MHWTKPLTADTPGKVVSIIWVSTYIIEYEKKFIGEGHCIGVNLAYLKSEKIKMDPVVERIMKSFTAKDLDYKYDHKQNKLVH